MNRKIDRERKREREKEKEKERERKRERERDRESIHTYIFACMIYIYSCWDVLATSADLPLLFHVCNSFCVQNIQFLQL